MWTEGTTRRDLNSALGALFLPQTQVLFNAVLAKPMQALHKRVRVAHLNTALVSVVCHALVLGVEGLGIGLGVAITRSRRRSRRRSMRSIRCVA